MFEIKFVIRDKHLADILRSVQGVAVEPPVVLPIEEGVRFVKTPATAALEHLTPESRAAVNIGKATAVAHTARREGRPNLEKLVKNWLDNQNKLVRFVPELLIPTLVENGFQKGSVAYAVQLLVKAGRLKKKPGRGQYEVVNASTKQKVSK